MKERSFHCHPRRVVVDAATVAWLEQATHGGREFTWNRAWSNPSLTDRKAIIALILDDPSTPDLALAMSRYGTDEVDMVRNETSHERSPLQNRILDENYEPVREGVGDALASAP